MMASVRIAATGVLRGLGEVFWQIGTLPERSVQGLGELVADVIAATTWRGRLLGLGMLVALATLPDWAGPRLTTVMIAALWLAYASQAWNLVSGFAGLLSLGHALFVGLGAYCGVILCFYAGINPWLGLCLVMPMVALAGTALGALALRTGRPELSFALLTLAGAEACRLGTTTVLVLPSVYPSHFLPDLRGQPVLAYYLILGLTLAALVLCRLLLRSGLGYRWLAVRENPAAAASLGVNLFRTRLSAMAVSAALTAPAGVFLALSSGILVPDQLFSATRSMEIVLGAVVGGLGTVFGPVLGALVLAPADEGLAWLGQRVGHPVPGLAPFCYGLLLVLLVLFRPGGVWPWLAHRLRLVPPALAAEGIPTATRPARPGRDRPPG